MRKIKLLLVAVLALVGMNAFAQIPADGAVGYLYNIESKKFLNLELGGDATGAIFQVKNEGTQRTNKEAHSFVEDPATDENPYTYLRFAGNKETSKRLSVSATGLQYKNEYAIWAAKVVDGDLVLRCVYKKSQRAWITTDGPCGWYLAFDANNKLILSETKSHWQFVDQDTHDALVKENATPKEGDLGYLYNPAIGKFIDASGAIAKTGAQYTIWRKDTDNKATDIRFGNPSNPSGKHLRIDDKSNKLKTSDASYSKWGYEVTTEGKLLLKAGYDWGDYCKKGNYLTAKEDGTFEYVAEAKDGSYWQFVDQATYDALIAALTPPVFPEAGAVGYLYNPAADMFITKDAKLAAKGDAVTIINEGASGDFINLRFEFSAGNRLNFNGAEGMSGTGTSYAKFSVKETEKGLIMTHAYPNPDNPAWMKENNLGGTYMVANGEELWFKPLEEIGEYGYWQFIDQDTYNAMFGKFNPEITYYLKNAESGLFFGGENNWGTRGTLSDRGDGYNFIELPSGAYELKNTLVTANDKKLGANLYVDNAGANGGWTVTKVGKGIFTIFNAEPGYLAQGTEALAKGVAAVGVKEVNNAAKWYILTKDQAKAQMAEATGEKPVPATFLINNPGFNRNYSNADWKMEASNQNLCGGTDHNKCAESWHATFTLSQVLTDVPNGVYALTAQGFYGQDGTDNTNLPVFYANDETCTFPAKAYGESSMDQASNNFAEGKYTISPIIFKVEDGKITLGAKLATNTKLWCIWDNFVLTYYGTEVTVNDLKMKAVIEQYKDILVKAQALLPETMPADKLVALDKALKDYAEGKVITADATLESVTAAYDALSAAYNAAKASVDSSKALMAMYELMEHNNVVTAEAYDTYMGKFEQYSKQWQAGTLAEAVVNPYNLNGWHANLDYDDYLLSAWTVGGEQCKDYDKALYINTWSVEGDNDGTDFKVPFFEYWTNDGNSLGANELEATLTDLPSGQYEVTAWVRVRAKNGTAAADATGITLQVNDGEVVDVTEGDVVKDSQFNLAEYKAEGDVEDGTLKVKFNVAEDNNISWLSFQNVKYVKTGDLTTAITEVGNKAAAKTIFNVAGQQMNGLQKGLNIVDGKKVYLK